MRRIHAARASLLQYIYISEGEMAAVADFITSRGRISIAELAARSEALIDLTPAAAPVPLTLPGEAGLAAA